MSSVKKVCAGFHVDLTVLLSEFIALDTVRYVDFARLWRNYKFSLLFW